MKAKRIMRSVLSMVLALSLAFGGYVLPAKAADTFNYVSLGASNTNGYGLKGFYTDSEISQIIDGKSETAGFNAFGYQRSPEGSYPDLVRDNLAKSHGTVNFTQLAMSYMRAEDLRVLLDEDYDGDAYTKWKFTGGVKWFNNAESGGISALREKYQNSIKNADLVTVDLGWENFGTYLIEQLMAFMTEGQLKWEADLADIFDTNAELEAANEIKDQVKEKIAGIFEKEETLDLTAEVLTYCMLSYVDSFDAVIAKIYELNPNAQIVVVGTQNLLYDAKLNLGGETVDAAGVFDEFVDMANYYMSARSPYCDNYLYVKAGGSDEHATMFLDEIREYKVYNPANLSDNIKDCFDYYDETVLLETRIGQAVDDLGLGSLGATLMDSIGGYDIADDTLAEILRTAAVINPVNLDEVSGDVTGAADTLINYVVDEVTDNIMGKLEDDAYTVDVDQIANDPLLSAVGAVYVRVLMGHGFFNHMNTAGHQETADAINNILANPSSEKEQALSAEFKEMVIANQQKLCGARGHDIEGKIVRATEDQDGYVSGTCKACGLTEDSVIAYPETVKLSYTSAKYTGKARKGPAVTVTGSDGKEISSAYYEVQQGSGRTKVGRYKVTVTFNEDYYDVDPVVKYWKIKPNGTSISSLTKASKAITVK